MLLCEIVEPWPRQPGNPTRQQPSSNPATPATRHTRQPGNPATHQPRYSSELYEAAKLDLLTRLLNDVDLATESAEKKGLTLPWKGGWGDLAGMFTAPGDPYRVRPGPPTGDLAAEQSDSDSPDDSDGED